MDTAETRAGLLDRAATIGPAGHFFFDLAMCDINRHVGGHGLVMVYERPFDVVVAAFHRA